MRYFLFVLLTAMLVACTAGVSQETPSPVAIIIEPPPPTADIPTETATLPPTDTPTETATLPPTDSPTETATPLPTLTPTPPPAPAGRILFFWDPNNIDPLNTRPDNLYFAVSNNDPIHWDVQPILTDLVIGNALLSPDSTQLAFNKWDDSDNNGDILPQFQGDISNLYLFSLVSSELIPLTHNLYSTYGFSWLPDNQGLIYDAYGNFDQSDLFQVNTVNLLSQKLSFDIIATNDDIHSYFYYPHVSPNSQFLIANHKTGIISPNGGLNVHLDTPLLVNLSSHSLTTIDTTIINPTKFSWSPNGQFVAINSRYSTGLNIFDVNLMQMNVLVLPDFSSLFAWSSHSQQLAFTQTAFPPLVGRAGTSVLNLWNSELPDSKMIFQTNYISQPVWSPDDSHVAAGFIEGGDGGMVLVNTQAENIAQLWAGYHTEEIYPLAWSSDSEWLLFFHKTDEQAGMFLIHKSGAGPYLMWETTNRYTPRFIYWLP